MGLRLVVVLLLSLVAGCTSGADDPPAPSAGSTGAGPSPGDGGPLDAVATEEPLGQDGRDGQIRQVTLDADGEPVVLFASLEDEPLLVSRRDGDGWRTTRLTAPPVQEFDSSAAATDDGTLVVSGFVEGRFSFTRLAPDGAITSIPLTADLGAGDVGAVAPAVTPDGSTAYLGVVDREDQSRLLAVDLTTGAVRSEYRFPLDAAGLVAPRAIRLAGDRVLVTLHRGVDTSEESSRAAQVPWLARFDPDLRLVDEIPLAEAGSTAFEEALAVDDAGTAYVGLVVGEFATPGVEARLVQLPIDATTATTVATFLGDDLIDGLAVDPAGEWAYLAGLDDGEEEFTATVTAIDLTGERDPVTRSYCESTHVVGPSITPDGRSLVFAAACRGRPTLAQLFTLR